jgi:hypothetical protein
MLVKSWSKLVKNVQNLVKMVKNGHNSCFPVQNNEKFAKNGQPNKLQIGRKLVKKVVKIRSRVVKTLKNGGK